MNKIKSLSTAFVLLVSSVVIGVGCMKSSDSHADTDSDVHTDQLGAVGYEARSAEVDLWQTVSDRNGRPFFVQTVSYDRLNRVAYLAGYYPNPNYGGYSEWCSVSRTLTWSQVDALMSKMKNITICRFHTNSAIAVPMVFIPGGGQLRTDDIVYRAAAYPYDGVGVCNYEDLHALGQEILTQLAFTKPTSCVSTAQPSF